MNLIQEELQAAQSRMLRTFYGTSSKTPLVELSRENVAMVEAMIQNDSAYLKSSDATAEPKYNEKGNRVYGGSTAYWMTKLKTVLIDGEAVTDKEYHNRVEGAVEAVDRENSTHLNADTVGRNEITNRIAEIEKVALVDYLKRPDATGLKLFQIIYKKTHAASGARSNPSFASKFCHYACFYLFEGKDEQDNYSIYDNVLKKVLPLYISFYGLGKRNLVDYAEYRKTVDEIISISQAGISRNGFDHLLWYYFKGRIE